MDQQKVLNWKSHYSQFITDALRYRLGYIIEYKLEATNQERMAALRELITERDRALTHTNVWVAQVIYPGSGGFEWRLTEENGRKAYEEFTPGYQWKTLTKVEIPFPRPLDRIEEVDKWIDERQDDFDTNSIGERVEQEGVFPYTKL